jgi:hypothetical protein
MIQAPEHFLKSLAVASDRKILCCYCNPTPSLQVIRSAKSSRWCFERIVFPSQRLMFEAVRDAELEIYSCDRGIPTLTKVIPCQQLCVTA